MAIISASLNFFHLWLAEIGVLYSNGTICVNMGLMEKDRQDRVWKMKIFRNVLMVAAILAHSASCLDFLLKDDICRKYRVTPDFRNIDFMQAFISILQNIIIVPKSQIYFIVLWHVFSLNINILHKLIHIQLLAC